MALGIVLVVAAASITVKDEINYQFFSNNDAPATNQDSGSCADNSNIALIKIHGTIVNYKIDPNNDPNGIYDPDSVSSEVVAGYLEEIENDDRIKGVIVEIDSPGGSPTAGEEIMNPLLASTKPVVAFIRERGLSAGYLAATGAEKIYASPMSDVGSIGVTMSYLDNSAKNKKEGLTYNQLSTGKFKDSGDPDKELTAEEKNVFMADLEKIHRIFVEYVAQNRNMDIEAVTKLADGSSMNAQDAIDAGLIDAIGGLNEARSYLAGKIGEDAMVCDYSE